jgi:aldehyde:ferredoxin oxidoreductase
MPGGFMGKILWVDLSKGTFEEETIGEDLYRKFLGGYGLGARILFDRMPKKADPLGSGNILGLVPGLLTGTGAVFSGRFMVVAKSPLTGGWGDANCGGYFSPAIKKAGYDGIFIKGKSQKPVYILIDNGKHEIRDASHLWGRDAVEAESGIRAETGNKKIQVAVIGTSGEKLSLISGIVTDRGRIAARSGLGAVMGSKNLKAVAITGSRRVPVHDPETLKRETRMFLKRIRVNRKLLKVLGGRVLKCASVLLRILPFRLRQDPPTLWYSVLKKFGTSGILTLSVQTNDAGVKNWKGVGHIDFPLKKSVPMSDARITKFEVKKYGCHNCPLSCGGIVRVDEGPHGIEESHKPEYESIAALGSMTLVSDPYAVFKANDMCNRAGMDTISAGSTVAFAMECYEKGVITREDTGGLELTWGSAEALLGLLRMMIARVGIGDLLADGVKKASKKLKKGSEEYAVHAGGQELPMHDPRFDQGFGIGYYLEPAPGRHTNVSLVYWELEQIYLKFKEAKKFRTSMSMAKWYDPKDKGTMMSMLSKYMQVANGCGLCLFGLQIGGDMPVFQWVNAATGWDLKVSDFIEIGERIETLRHAFNLREGLRPLRDFKPTPRATGSPPMERGPTAGVTLDMERLARDFYEGYGWDYDTGKPREETLRRLGLSEVLEELYGQRGGA